MRIRIIPQIELGSLQRMRVGDVLNNAIGSPTCQQFRFAVAYMRLSGLDRLAVSLQALINRGGRVSGAVGIDQGITTIEALEALRKISSDSTIFHTVSGFIYHPKLYLISDEKKASPIAPPPFTVAPSHPTPQPGTFIMQLSAFDSSHRTGVPGTPEVLIPHAAIGFFPQLSLSGRKYPDVYFHVVLNTPTGRERHRYRLWYYEQRAIGTRIDEYRLRMDHDTIDLSSPGGGDLLVINKLPAGSVPPYEVTILPQTDPAFPYFIGLCKYLAQVKKWGMI